MHLPVLWLSMTLAGLSPTGVEGVARSIAQEAARDSRFDVVSELDVRDAIDFDAARQLCGGADDSCGSTLANLQDARLVLFSRIYMADGELFLALTLMDVKAGTVLHRGDVTTSERDLLVVAKKETSASLARFVEPVDASGARPRLLITRVAYDNDDLRKARVERDLAALDAETAAHAPWDIALMTGVVLSGATAIGSFIALELSMPDAAEELKSFKAATGLDTELVPSAVALVVSATLCLGLMQTKVIFDDAETARALRRDNLEAELAELAPDDDGGRPPGAPDVAPSP